MTLELYIDVLSMSLTRYGSGPLTLLTYWESTTRLDQAGSFSFEVSVSDPQAGEVQPLRIARAYAWLDGAWAEIGSGIIERIERTPAADGSVLLRVSGSDMLREFAAHVTIPSFQWAGGVPMTHAQAVDLVRQLPIFDGYTYSLWSGTPDPTPPNDVIQFATNQESCLFTARRVAEISGNHFFLSGFRALTYASTFAASGVRAIQPGMGPLDAETCAILQLTVASDMTEFVSRVYARGGGNGVAEMAMRYTTRTAPAGYSLDKTRGWLQNNALHGVFPSSRKVFFKDLRPLSNSTADIQAADNALFDSALAWLRSHSETYNAPLYRLAVGQCRQLLRPLQTIRVSYRNPDAGIVIESDLKILEATIRIDEDGLRTTNLAVRAIDYWPESEGQVLAESMQQGQIYQSAAQPDVNSYALALRGQIDSENDCTFAFRLGPEITQVQGCYFDFRVVPLEDATSAVTLAETTGTDGPTATGTDGPTATGTDGPTTTGTGGPTATGADGPTATGTGGPSITQQSDPGQTDVGGPGSTGTGGPTATGMGGPTATGTGGPTATGTGGPTATGTVGPVATGNNTNHSSDTVGPVATGNNTNYSSDTVGPVTTGNNTSISTDTGLHSHGFYVNGSTVQGYPVYFNIIDGVPYFIAVGMVGNVYFPVAYGGEHTHVLSDHTHQVPAHYHLLGVHQHQVPAHSHTLGAHQHQVPAHSHTLGAHQHTIDQHSHSVAQHLHTIDEHLHTIDQHFHTLPGHTHGVAQHSHSVAQHSHSVAQHSHSVAQHSHSMAQHSHSVAQHTHPAPAVNVSHKPWRESGPTLAVDTLEYKINGSSWLGVLTSLGSGWHRVDLTSVLLDAALRPLAELNIIEFRTTSQYTGIIEAQLTVRCSIQAVDID